MRHLNAGRKFHMDGSQRKAMFRNMVTALMLHGKICTTTDRAKEIRRIADRIITLGKRVSPGDLALLTGEELKKARARRVHAIRQARRWILDSAALDKVFNEYSERFKTRPGGYTRIYKLAPRPGDNAEMSLLVLCEAMDSTSTEESSGSEMAGEPNTTGTPENGEPVA